jgi:hypothetical protein
MINANILRSLLLAALLASASVGAADKTIQVDRERGEPVAQFKVGDSQCVLKDDAIRCTPVKK